MQSRGFTRRGVLKSAAFAVVGVIAAACQPKIVEVTREVEKVVKETVVVAGTPEVVEKVVKETVVVKEEVTRAAAPPPGRKLTLWGPKHFIEAQNDYFTDSALLSAANTNFEVDVQLFPWGDYGTKQNVAIEAGTMPDVFLGGMGF